jgi:glycerol-3-phosphate dehydrogenase
VGAIPGACDYDYLIVGAGIIGCAIARELVRSPVRVGVVEQAWDVGEGASKANSSLLHTGFDAKPGTWEARLVTEGWRLWQQEAPELGVPIIRTGAVMLALDEEQAQELERWRRNAFDNGVTDVELLTRDQVLALAPAANPAVVRGLLVPRESVTCTFTATVALAEQAAVNGAVFHFGHRVTGIDRSPNGFYRVLTDRGPLTARWLIDAAGLWADEIAGWAGADSFSITPRKGEFLVLDKSARAKVPLIHLPVPTPISKGILVAPTANGNVLLGPTAEDVSDKRDLAVTASGLQRAREGALRLAPALADEPVIATYAGLRPASSTGDYVIEIHSRDRLVLAAGIRSTGLSSAPAVAREVVRGLLEAGESLASSEAPLRPRPRRSWAPGQPRPCCRPELVAADPSYGRVLCLCELVSEGEIREVLRAPIPATTLDAVKKRTWATAGRCQGFYCTAAILQVMSRELRVPVAGLTKSGPGSPVVGPPVDRRGRRGHG